MPKNITVQSFEEQVVGTAKHEANQTAKQSVKQSIKQWVSLSHALFLLQLCGFTYLIHDCGLPIDAWTWIGMTTIYAGLCLNWLIRHWRGHFLRLSVTLLLVFFLVFPLSSDHLQDVRGGRWGVRLAPWGFRLSRPGVNTAVIESYLGPTPAQWRHRCIRSCLLGGWRDGNERVNSRNLIHHEELADVLGCLPSRTARVRVLRCLTNPKNHLRIHQCLLLSCLKTFGFPQYFDRERWWRRHQSLFIEETSPRNAAALTFDWHERCRQYLPEEWYRTHYSTYRLLSTALDAVRYQDRGAWGGSHEFAEQRWQLFLMSAENRAKAIKQVQQQLSSKAVHWWPVPSHEKPN